MPCFDQPSHEDRADELRQVYQSLAKRDAMLCAVIRAFPESYDVEKFLHHNIDTEEAGVSGREIVAWWREHQRKDEERLARERAQAEKERLRQKALGKLTAGERKLLGLAGKGDF